MFADNCSAQWHRLSLSVPAEGNDQRFPEVFDAERVAPLLTEKAMVQHNITITVTAGLYRQKLAISELKTSKKQKKADIDSLPESLLVKTLKSEMKVIAQLRDFIADQREQAIFVFTWITYMHVFPCVVLLCDMYSLCRYRLYTSRQKPRRH